MQRKKMFTTTTNIVEDKFGFLPKNWAFILGDIDIAPINNFDKAKNYIEKYTNIDGYYYPSSIYKVSVDFKTGKILKKIPKTERPAHLHKMPSSHIIKVKNATGDIVNLRKGLSGFLVHLLGYLFGTRLQFDDWWVDNRIPMKSQHGVIFNEKEAEDFLQHSIKKWGSWSLDKKQFFTNLLFMHTRTSSYEWEWERFMMEYIVFDGCWKFYSYGQNSKIKHEDRLENILGDLGMVIHKDKIKKIVNLRNGLFHEALWEGNQPGTHASNEAFYSYMWLQSINQRLFPALLNYQTKYITSDWACMGQFLFKS